MMPPYRFMDSYPNQQDQMPWIRYQYPSYGAFQPQMKMDASRPPFMYESWPHSNYCSSSVPFHGCCNHNNFPGYYNFRPPCPHVSLIPACQYCGNYSPNREAVHYMPPPHYPVELPRYYECDKDASRNYHCCCRCPNHIHEHRNERGVKIEEQEPEADKKVNNSLVPNQSKNYPYQVLWIPPEYCKSKEQQKPIESKVSDQSKALDNMEIPESLKSSKQEPRVWDGWFPFDTNSLESLLQENNGKRTQMQKTDDKSRLVPGQEPKVWNGWFPIDANGLKLQEKDVKRNQDQQKEEKMSQLPIPIVWMPSSNKQEEVEKHDNNATNAASKTAEEMPNFRFIPVNLPHYDDSTNKLKAGEEKCDSQADAKTVEEHFNQENRPMKQTEVLRQKDSSEDTERRGRSVSTKHGENNETNKPSQTVANRQSSSSSPKASKLPPICLRVDPLPRKKNGNGSSRSPSPPGTKERVEDTGKDSISSEIKENFLHEKQAKDDSLKQIKEVEPVTKEIENIEVANTRSINKDGELGHRPQAQIPVNLPIGSLDEISMESTGVSKEKGDDECREGGAGHAQAMTADKTILTEKVADLQASGGGECKPKKKLSDVEAAVLIQSAYRGFQVRRWEPIKKLKQMDKVQEQMAEVKSRIQALESSSDLTKDDRQRVVIGEMIMNLLLKLDTIQGLHPSLRDIRKGLANELVSLQVQLDALMMKKSRESTEEAFTVVPANNHVVEMQSDVSMENKEAAGFGRDQRENYCDRSENMKEKEQGQNLLLHKTDAVSDSRDKEVANTESYDEEKHRTHDNEVQEIPVHSGIECQAAEQTAIVGSPDDTGHGGSEDTQQAMTVNPEGFDMPTCVEHSVQQLKATDGKTGSEDDMPTADDYQEVKEPKDFPQALISEESGVSAAERNEKVQSDLSENLTKRARDDDLMLNNNEAGQNLLAGLPVEVIDEENIVATTEKREHLETQRDEVPQNGEGVCDVSVDKLSHLEKGPSVSQSKQHQMESEDWVKDAQHVDEDLPGDNMFEMEVDKPVKKEVLDNDKKVSATSEETHFTSPTMTTVDNEGDKDEYQNTNEVGPMLLPESDSVVNAQENTMQFVEEEKEIVNHESATSKKEVQEELESSKPEAMGNDSNTSTEVGIHSSPQNEELAVEGGELELSTPSPSASQVSRYELDTRMERDKKLIEKNEKLREMIKKLMIAGTEQLDAISSLTGRVKDLEKKLSKKKKLKMRYHRRPVSAGSCAKPSHDSVKERAVDVAM